MRGERRLERRQRTKAIRDAVRRLLREPGYLPDFEANTIELIVQQAEALAQEIARSSGRKKIPNRFFAEKSYVECNKLWRLKALREKRN